MALDRLSALWVRTESESCILTITGKERNQNMKKETKSLVLVPLFGIPLWMLVNDGQIAEQCQYVFEWKFRYLVRRHPDIAKGASNIPYQRS